MLLAILCSTILFIVHPLILGVWPGARSGSWPGRVVQWSGRGRGEGNTFGRYDCSEGAGLQVIFCFCCPQWTLWPSLGATIETDRPALGTTDFRPAGGGLRVYAQAKDSL